MNILYLVFLASLLKLNDHFLKEKNNLYIYMAAGLFFPANIYLNNYITQVEYIPNQLDMFLVITLWVSHIIYLGYKEIKKNNKYKLNNYIIYLFIGLSIPIDGLKKVILMGLLSYLYAKNLKSKKIDLIESIGVLSIISLNTSLIPNYLVVVLMYLIVLSYLFKNISRTESLFIFLLISYFQIKVAPPLIVTLTLYFICLLSSFKFYIETSEWSKLIKMLRKIKWLERIYWNINFAKKFKEIRMNSHKEIKKGKTAKLEKELVVDNEYINILFVIVVFVYLVGYLYYA